MLPPWNKNVTLSFVCPSLPFFSGFLPQYLHPSFSVAVYWYTHSIVPPLSSSAISLISLCSSGSLSFNRHNKEMLWFLIHRIPAVHLSMTQPLPTASHSQTHLQWTYLWSSYTPDWLSAKGGAFITKEKYIKSLKPEKEREGSTEDGGEEAWLLIGAEVKKNLVAELFTSSLLMAQFLLSV